MSRHFSLVVLFASLAILNPSESIVLIDPASELMLHGSSNVNKFKCKCNDQFPKASMKFVKNKSKTSGTFSNAFLNLRVVAFDCGNKLMNKDMHKTLKSEQYPQIRIELLQVKQLDDTRFNVSTDWAPQIVEAALTIAGVKRIVDLNVNARQTETGRYQFVSDKNILMTDFGLTPPKALMGTIKVNDLIRIHLDLTVDIQAGM